MDGRNGREFRNGPDGLKLVIQIPCYEEEETLRSALADLPREVEGFGCVEWLVVDDGSRDRTSEIARAEGVDHVVRLRRNRGLAAAWSSGIEAALRVGADVIVNTDADNQYDGGAIADLARPVRDGDADVAVGSRPIADHPHFSRTKKVLQLAGSAVVRGLSRAPVEDAPSGFRALSREAACRMVVLDDYTYTIETLFHAGRTGMAVVNVPVGVNPDLRPSRLMRSVPGYVWRTGKTIVRFLLLYEAARIMAWGAAAAGAAAAGCAISWIVRDASGAWGVAAGFLGTSAVVLAVGSVVADGVRTVSRTVHDVRRISLREIAEREGSRRNGN